ncbi:MAG: DUF948 domain-containing protein [Candidatus Rokubacteria bacterium]|nr:DUF948 domain-containing protein [Candidatus Rokubacteria bacterium]
MTYVASLWYKKIMIITISLAVMALAVLLFVGFTIPALWEIKRTSRSAADTLDTIRREIHPLSTQLQGALEDHRDLTHRASREMARIEELTERVKELTERWGRIVGFAATVGRVGQIAGAVHGVRKGLDVFLTRLTRRR